MGMITIGWSLKQRHQRQASIMSLYFNLPFAAIALIFLMSCSLGKILFALDFIFKDRFIDNNPYIRNISVFAI